MTDTTQPQPQTKPSWAFETSTDEGVSGTFTVHQGTGHWSRLFDYETATVGAGVYVYEATFHGADGSTWNTAITQNDLRRLRRAATRQASQEGQAK